MDGHRFDTIARALASSRSRRGLLKTAAGALAGMAGMADTRGASPVAAAGAICSAAAAACQQQAAQDYHLQVQDCAQNFGETPYTKLACLGSALETYHLAQPHCVVRACDPSNCEQCVNGACQSACPAGIACVGGQCAGCPGDQHKCGAACCASNQACCAHGCCDHGITTCNPDGACGCPAGEKPCGGTCIPAGQCCTSADCPPNTVCRRGTCQQVGCRPLGETCGGDAQCCSGLCQFNACATTTTSTTTTAAPTAPPGTCGGCVHWDDCPDGGTCSSCFVTSSSGGQCETVVCGHITCPKPTAANHRAVCCNGQCDLACFATVGFSQQGPQRCEGYNAFGGPNECAQQVPCQGSSAACNGTCTA